MALKHKIGDLVVCKLGDETETYLKYALGHISDYNKSLNKYSVVWHDNEGSSYVSVEMVDEMKNLIGRLYDGTEKINEREMPKTW